MGPVVPAAHPDRSRGALLALALSLAACAPSIDGSIGDVEFSAVDAVGRDLARTTPKEVHQVTIQI